MVFLVAIWNSNQAVPLENTGTALVVATLRTVHAKSVHVPNACLESTVPMGLLYLVLLAKQENTVIWVQPGASHVDLVVILPMQRMVRVYIQVLLLAPSAQLESTRVTLPVTSAKAATLAKAPRREVRHASPVSLVDMRTRKQAQNVPRVPLGSTRPMHRESPAIAAKLECSREMLVPCA